MLLIITLFVLGIIIFISVKSKNQTNIVVISGETAAEQTAAGIDAETTGAQNDAAPEGIPAPSEQNDLLEIIRSSDAAGGEKTCYLTFDDGPSDNVTPRILDTLRKYNIKATFFQVGTSISANPDMARRVYEEGHLIANHSDSHNYDKLYASEESFADEVLTNEELINGVTGGEAKMKLFRFPGGSFNTGDHAAEKQIYKTTLAENGFYYVDWNTLNGDAEGAKKSADELLAYIQRYTDTSSSAVVLMHDAAAKTVTADALDSIIQYFISEGYAFKRLDEIPIPETANTAAEEVYAEYGE
ncbi:MAG: polysaccharide deacetylase [Firmicutes bacterium]|nr:polysaccharide deacetylase [Bacillota bacterium]